MADDRLLTDILARLARLEESAVRLRVGTLTSRTPLNVQLGGAIDEADDPAVYSNVPGMGHMNDGDKVAALFAGRSLLVLGLLGAGMTSGNVNVFGTGATTRDVVVDHDLGVMPRVVIATIGEGANAGLNVGVMTRNATTFTLRLRHVDDIGWSSSVWVYWLAIGE
jgi:hypothetical protein